MKKAMLIFILSAMLTACGNVADTQPSVIEETMTASQMTKKESYTTASEMTITAVSSRTSSSQTTTTRKTSTSESTESTAKVVISTTESAVYTQKTESAAETESKHIVTTVQTDPPMTTTSAARQQTTTQAQTTTTQPVTTTTKATTTTKPVTTTVPPTTTTAAPPAELGSAVDKWLNNFGDSHDKAYYVDVGSRLSHDGSDYGKAEAIFDYMQNDFFGEQNCIYMSSITYALCEGAGLECGFALISDWYNHCANAVNIYGTWYVLDTQAGGFLCGDLGYTRIIDEYENSLRVTLSEDDYD